MSEHPLILSRVPGQCTWLRRPVHCGRVSRWCESGRGEPFRLCLGERSRLRLRLRFRTRNIFGTRSWHDLRAGPQCSAPC